MLIAYPYFSDKISKIIVSNQHRVRLVVDSGAFTAWKAGKPIALDDYCRFIESLPIKPWRYFTLDVIGDPHASMTNYEIMLKRGFNPVPIFTRGEDISVLDDYYKTSDVVGVGGLVGTPNNKGYVNGIMRRVNGRKVHLLGFAGINYTKFYKPYMCDSSTWEDGPRFGHIRLYMGNGNFKSLGRKDFIKRPPAVIEAQIKKFGFDASVFAKESAWRGGVSPNRQLCAASALAMSIDIQKNLKTLFFNACCTAEGVQMFFDSYKHQVEKRGVND